MKKRISSNKFYLAREMFVDSIKTIPKENQQKFAIDLIALIDKAHEEDYDKFEIR